MTTFNQLGRADQGYRAPVRRRGRFGLVGLIFVIVIVYVALAAINPWSLHIGGHWTPLMYWTGTGKLITNRGTYPLYLSLSPSSHFSGRPLHGVRATGGIQGNGSLCLAPGVIEGLKLSGTIYGGWRSTDGALMELRLLEYKALDLGGKRNGYFNLYGKWNGPELVMDDGGEPGSAFYSGLKIDRASVVLNWASYSDFKAMCARSGNAVPRR